MSADPNKENREPNQEPGIHDADRAAQHAAGTKVGTHVAWMLFLVAMVVVGIFLIIAIRPGNIESTVPALMVLCMVIGLVAILFGGWLIWFNVRAATGAQALVRNKFVGEVQISISTVLPGLVVVLIGSILVAIAALKYNVTKDLNSSTDFDKPSEVKNVDSANVPPPPE